MKKKMSIYGLVFLLISLVSLFYINFYERVIYIKPPMNRFLDTLYVIAILSFYYFIAAVIAVFVIPLLKINIHERLRKILKYAIGLTLILYIILVFSRVISFIPFYSVHSIILAVLGCLSPFTIKKFHLSEVNI